MPPPSPHSPFNKFLNAAESLVAPVGLITCNLLHDGLLEVDRHPLGTLAGAAVIFSAEELLQTHHTIHLSMHSNKKYAQELQHEADDDRVHNQHLAAAVGLTIADILRHHLPPGIIPPSDNPPIQNLADIAVDSFKDVAASNLSLETFDDANLPHIIQSAVEGHFQPFGDLGMWTALLHMMAQHPTPDGSLLSNQIPDTTLATVAQTCREKFVERFFNTIKSDFKDNGPAFASIHLRMIGELIVAARDCKERDRITQQKLDAITASLAASSNTLLAAQTPAQKLELAPLILWLARLDQSLVLLPQIKHDTSAILQNQTLDRQLTQENFDQLRTQLSLIQKILDNKPAPNTPGFPPPISSAGNAAAESIAQNPEATLLQRTQAAIVASLPQAPNMLDQLDQSIQHAEFCRHQLRGDYHYFRGEYDDAIQPYEKALLRAPHDLRAANDLVMTLIQARLGNVAEHCRQAILIATKTLTRNPLPSLEWAKTQNNLGLAWQKIPTGDKAANLAHAIAAFHAALIIYTRADHPLEWAMTQHNVGLVSQQNPAGDKTENLRNAIAAYQAALTIYTRENHPLEWAKTQNNLGIAWQHNPAGEKIQNLRNAIDAYNAALTIRTKIAHPLAWATTQNNLGLAWQNFPSGDLSQNLHHAIEAYQAALTVYTQSTHPADWAMTHHNLALALADSSRLVGQNATLCLQRAIASDKAALIIYTPETFPHEYALSHQNLQLHTHAYQSTVTASSLPPNAIPAAP